MSSNRFINLISAITLIDLFHINKSDFLYPMPAKYETLSPDSFIFGFKAGTAEKFYVIYQEDFIDNLDFIKKQIEEWWSGPIKKFFQPIIVQIEPNHYYMQRPAQWDSLSKYAALDGHFYTFLAEVAQPDNESYFAKATNTDITTLNPKIQAQLKSYGVLNDPKASFLENLKINSEKSA